MTEYLERVAAALAAVEAELGSVFDSIPVPTPEQIAAGGAFGHKTMAFPQWLRHVFGPIVRERLAGGNLPPGSQVSVQAIREFDGFDAADRLVELLIEFDALIERGA